MHGSEHKAEAERLLEAYDDVLRHAKEQMAKMSKDADPPVGVLTMADSLLNKAMVHATLAVDGGLSLTT